MHDTGKTETHRRRASFSDECRWKKNDVKDRDAQCEEAAVLLQSRDPSAQRSFRAIERSAPCASSGLRVAWGGETAEVSRCHPSLDGGHMRKGRGESVRSDCGATASRRRRCGDEKEHNNLARMLWFFAPRCVHANADAGIGAFTKRQVPVKAAPNGGHFLGPGQLGTRAE